MSDQSVPPHPNLTPDELGALLVHVENACGRAAGIVNAAARLVAGEALGLHDNEMPALCTVALEHAADELEALSDRALKARTGAA